MHLQEHLGADVQGDMEAAIAMAQHLEVYHGGDGAKASGGGKGSKGFKNQKQKKRNMAQVKGSSSRGTVRVVHEETIVKKGQGWFGLWWKENQVLCTCQTVWHCPVLWAKKESANPIPNKRLHNHNNSH